MVDIYSPFNENILFEMAIEYTINIFIFYKKRFIIFSKEKYTQVCVMENDGIKDALAFI